MFSSYLSRFLVISAGSFFCMVVHGQTNSDAEFSEKNSDSKAAVLDTVYVWGKRQDGIGAVDSASEGTVSFGEFADRPLLRTGEIAEVIPGLAVIHQVGGKEKFGIARIFEPVNRIHADKVKFLIQIFPEIGEGSLINLRHHQQCCADIEAMPVF